MINHSGYGLHIFLSFITHNWRWVRHDTVLLLNSLRIIIEWYLLVIDRYALDWRPILRLIVDLLLLERHWCTCHMICCALIHNCLFVFIDSMFVPLGKSTTEPNAEWSQKDEEKEHERDRQESV